MNTVLETTMPVVFGAKDVRINQNCVRALAKAWVNQNVQLPLWPEDVYLTSISEDKRLNHLFVIDALNFCFWPDKNEEQWEIEYQNKWYRGAFGLAMALRKAHENNVPITDFRYLRQITIKELESVFAGKGKIPLLTERLEILHDSSIKIICCYGDQVKNLVADARGSALKLAFKLAEEFHSFNDQAVYDGKKVLFLKRAQLLVADIWGSFRGEGIGRFDDIDKLTALADYRVPQVLEHLGILEYSSDLKKKIKNKELLPPGSREEVEIRAAMIWASEMLRQALESNGKELNAIQIDRLLWTLGQGLKKEPNLIPNHRTKTIYY